jgi:hypothetical protein
VVFFAAFPPEMLQHCSLWKADEREGQLRDLGKENIVRNMNLCPRTSSLLDTWSVERLVEHSQSWLGRISAQILSDSGPTELLPLTQSIDGGWQHSIGGFRIETFKTVSQGIHLEHLASTRPLSGLIASELI